MSRHESTFLAILADRLPVIRMAAYKEPPPAPAVPPPPITVDASIPEEPRHETGTSERRNTEVRLTHRWREMDSNFWYRGLARTKPTRCGQISAPPLPATRPVVFPYTEITSAA